MLAKSLNYLFQVAVGLLVVACVNSSNFNEEETTRSADQTIMFETDEGTWMNVDVSPDGKTLVFDMLGDLYLLPLEGGVATPVTQGMAWDSGPIFSRDGEDIYFVSDRIGHKNMWKLRLSDGHLQQITRLNADILSGPNWSQNRNALVTGIYYEPAKLAREAILHAIVPETGEIYPINEPSEPWFDLVRGLPFRTRHIIFSGVEAPDGTAYYAEQVHLESSFRRIGRIYGYDPKVGVSDIMTPTGVSYSDFKPQLSPDGTLLAYYRQYPDRRTEIRIRDIKSGADNFVTQLEDADDSIYSQSDDMRPNYAFVPNGRALIYTHNGKIWRTEIADGATTLIPFVANVVRKVKKRAKPVPHLIDTTGQATAIRWSSLSRDGQTMAYAAIGHIWVLDVKTGDQHQLTPSEEFAFMPSISPDGASIAYVSFEKRGVNNYGPARLILADVGTGETRVLLSDPGSTYYLPNWSHDGSKIALIRKVKIDGGDQVEFGWTSLEDGVFNNVATEPPANVVAGNTIFARNIGFDASDRHILFSHPYELSGTALYRAKLDGSHIQQLGVSGGEIGGITPAPDLKHLALTRRNGAIWVIPFDAEDPSPQLDIGVPGAWRVSRNAGYYVEWNTASSFTYGFGKKVLHYDLNDNTSSLLRNIGASIGVPQAEQKVALVGARLVTIANAVGAGPVIESGSLVLSGHRIVAVGPTDSVKIPKGALVIDLTGKTLMPGLLDTHYHYIGGPSHSAFKMPHARYYDDQSALRYGVSTAWDPNGAMNDGASATADLQLAGRLFGPRWSHGAAGSVGHPYTLLTSYQEARSAVEQHQELGVHTLKEYLAPTRQQRQWVADAAREKGLGIVSHIDNYTDFMTRIVDGYTGGDHPDLPMPLYKDVQEMLRQTGFIWTPNTIITSGSLGSPGGKTIDYCANIKQGISEEKLGKPHRIPENCVSFWGQDPINDNHRVNRVAKQVAQLAHQGVAIGVSAHNVPASLLHMEMWYMHKGGMPIADVLRAATMTNAEKLGLQEEVGSLEVGKMADFLILDDNPLDDILNTLSIKYTIQGGVIYDADTAERVDPMDFPLCTDEIRGQDVCREVTIH